MKIQYMTIPFCSSVKCCSNHVCPSVGTATPILLPFVSSAGRRPCGEKLMLTLARDAGLGGLKPWFGCRTLERLWQTVDFFNRIVHNYYSFYKWRSCRSGQISPFLEELGLEFDVALKKVFWWNLRVGRAPQRQSLFTQAAIWLHFLLKMVGVLL